MDATNPLSLTPDTHVRQVFDEPAGAIYSAIEQHSLAADKAMAHALSLTDSAADCACMLGVPRALITCIVLGPKGGGR